jgi:hypothetical protein
VKVDAERVSVDRFDRGRAADRFAPEEALVAMIIGGVFEFHPKLRVGFLEAQNSWAPGLLSRIEWDYPQYRDSHAPCLALTPREYFRRNCWPPWKGASLRSRLPRGSSAPTASASPPTTRTSTPTSRTSPRTS